MNTNELINNVHSGDNVKANKTFDSVMGEKLKAALDAKKIEIASVLGSSSTEEPEIEVPVVDGE